MVADRKSRIRRVSVRSYKTCIKPFKVFNSIYTAISQNDSKLIKTVVCFRGSNQAWSNALMQPEMAARGPGTYGTYGPYDQNWKNAPVSDLWLSQVYGTCFSSSEHANTWNLDLEGVSLLFKVQNRVFFLYGSFRHLFRKTTDDDGIRMNMMAVACQASAVCSRWKCNAKRFGRSGKRGQWLAFCEFNSKQVKLYSLHQVALPDSII